MSRRSNPTENAALVRGFLEWLDNNGRSPETIYTYRQMLLEYVTHVGTKEMGSMSITAIEQFLERPRKRSNNGRLSGQVGRPGTIKRDLATLKSFYRWANARGFVTSNPTEAIVGPKVVQRQPKPIPDHVWQQVWFNPVLSADEIVMLGLGYYMGLRRHEMVTLTRAQLDAPAQRVNHFKRKGGGSHTLIYGSMLKLYQSHLGHLSDAERLLGAIESLLARDTDNPYLFTWADQTPQQRIGRTLKHPLPPGMSSPTMVNKHLAKTLASCGVDGSFSPHALRHSFVTNMVRMGVRIEVVAELANHSDINVTRRYLSHGSDPLEGYTGGALIEDPLESMPMRSRWQ